MSGTACRIPLSKGFALVDESDAAAVNEYRWSLSTSGRTKYARRKYWLAGRQVQVYLHRFLLGADSAQEIDHINGDGLDNRRCNIRFCTRGENSRNSRWSHLSSTGFRGVTLDKTRGKYLAAIHVDDRRLHLGRYSDARDAALAYDVAARRLHGAFARLNFPKVGEQHA